MAQDQIEVMAALGFERFNAAGHDRGARVLHRMCLDHPDKVARAAILDIIPQHYLLNNVTRQWGTFSWHWFFMIQPYDFPERLMGADPDYFIEKKLSKTAQGLSFFDPAGAGRIQALFPQSRDRSCDVRGLSRHSWCRPRYGQRRILPPDARSHVRFLLLWDANGGVGRNQKSDGDLAALCGRYPGGQGSALRALSFGRSAG